MRDQHVGDARHRAGTGDRVGAYDDCQYQKDRHHELGNTLNAVFHAHIDDHKVEGYEDAEPEFSGSAVCDEIRKEGVCSNFIHISGKECKEIFAYPAADDGIVGADQDRNDRVDPAACFCPGGIAEKLERAYRTFLRRASDRRLGDDHRVAKCEGKDDVNK